ncbi:MAG: site-2 protease family protein [Christensenellaceae bacterium]|nr:site-2 protease family protein [Christensenellaceae bacterium]
MLWSIFSDPMQIVYRVPAILFALSMHEWAHAFAAFRLGDPTARNFGRLTINPIPHIDPIGLLSLLLLGFGWAKPVPINTRFFHHPRRDELIVSVAGVVTNLLLAFVSAGVFFLFAGSGIQNEAAYQIIFNFISINLGLCVFNLLPLPPLDGYHVAECLFLRGKTSFKIFSFLGQYGAYILYALVLTGAISNITLPVTGALLRGIMAFWGLLL